MSASEAAMDEKHVLGKIEEFLMPEINSILSYQSFVPTIINFMTNKKAKAKLRKWVLMMMKRN